MEVVDSGVEVVTVVPVVLVVDSGVVVVTVVPVVLVVDSGVVVDKVVPLINTFLGQLVRFHVKIMNLEVRNELTR